MDYPLLISLGLYFAYVFAVIALNRSQYRITHVIVALLAAFAIYKALKLVWATN